MVFGLFNVIDQFAGFILRFIPFYYVLKVAILIWLFHPSLQGASYIYREYIHPYAEDISNIEKSIQDAANNGIDGVKKATGLKKD